MTLPAARMFPLVLMLALALLSFWLERAAREDDPHPSLRRHDPDYMVDRFVITTYGRHGVIESVLSAQRMVHTPDDDMTVLDAPRVVQSKPGEPRMVIRASTGRLSGDGAEIFLLDDVVLVREALGVRPEARMQTDFLHLVRTASLVRTDRHVSIREPGRTLEAHGLEYFNETGRLQLHDRVRGSFAARGRTP